MDEIIDRLYRIELTADKSLDTLNEKKIQLKNKYDNFRTDYQKAAENKFSKETAQLKEQYEQEKNQELKVIEENYEINLTIRKICTEVMCKKFQTHLTFQ